MLRDDAVGIVQTMMGFRTDLAPTIVTMFQFVQTMLETGPPKPWFLLSEDSLVQTTIGDERVEVPADFLEEHNELPFRYRPIDYPTEDEVLLRKDDYSILKQNFAPSTISPGSQQIPQAYAKVGKYFRIFPLPDANYMLRLIYYAKDVVLTTNITNQWLTFVPDLMIGKAGKLVATGARDAGAWASFDEMEKAGMATLVRANTAQDVANTTPQMGGPVRGSGRSGLLPPGISPDEIDTGN
jgi:hypothetical protein